MPFDRLAI